MPTKLTDVNLHGDAHMLAHAIQGSKTLQTVKLLSLYSYITPKIVSQMYHNKIKQTVD